MKIHDKWAFLIGLLCLCTMVLPMIFGKSEFQVWTFVLYLLLAAKLLQIGLSEKESRRYRVRSNRYTAAGELLYGKYYSIKAYLPLILTGVFFAVALLLRFLFQIYTAPLVAVGFVLLLAVSVFYTIGMSRSIREYLDAHPEFDAEDL